MERSGEVRGVRPRRGRRDDARPGKREVRLLPRQVHDPGATVQAGHRSGNGRGTRSCAEGTTLMEGAE